ncbi:hypothetical protein M0R45_010855 [Rubus argutus]|uniref:Uncharacterized protein n=1 Tax=Rubus argutus TaxID=59490 RepID=A0AAW1Y8A6_RUBAR
MAKKPVKYSVVDAFTDSAFKGNPAAVCWFSLRWFTPVAEVELCGHATLAAAYTLFKSDNVKAANGSNIPNGEAQDSYFIELNFPADPSSEFNSADVSFISHALGGASVIEIRATITDNLLVVLPSGKTVADLQPQFDAINNVQCTLWLSTILVQKTGKSVDVVAYQASPRGGMLNIHLDEQNQRVLLRGEAVTVMEGTVLV